MVDLIEIKEIFSIASVDRKHRINFTGEYNSAIVMCPNCIKHYRDIEKYFIGFAEIPEEKNWKEWEKVCAIWECPKCFEKFWFHSLEGTYFDYLRHLDIEVPGEIKPIKLISPIRGLTKEPRNESE